MKTMQRAFFAAAMACACGAAMAHETGDCFPLCAAAPQEAPRAGNLCEHAIVREGVRIERETRPLRDVVNAVQDPAGFVIGQVSAHVVPIPRWVGYVLNPRGAVRAKVFETVRDELKKSTGLASECREAEAPEEADYSAIT